MGRPATGYVRFNISTARWEVRVSKKDGTRSPPIPIVDAAGQSKIPPCTLAPEKPASGCTCTSCSAARAAAVVISKRHRNGAAVDMATSETVSEWFGRYYDWREKRGRKAERGSTTLVGTSATGSSRS